jgi:hypothetical protein
MGTVGIVDDEPEDGSRPHGLMRGKDMVSENEETPLNQKSLDESRTHSSWER